MATQTSVMALKSELSAAPGAKAGTRPLRIVLIRHGRPAIATAPVARHWEFRHYIDDYEDAGLDPADAPPRESIEFRTLAFFD